MEAIAVIGAGLMGHGIAQVFAVAGHPVVIADESADVLATVHARVRANLERSGDDASAVDRIRTTDDIDDAVSGAGFVIEAAPEDLGLKQGIFARMSRTTDDAILASNTSVIPIGEIARDAVRPNRVVGTHFWNPPHLIPVVEVTEAAGTSADTVERTMALMASAGKTPVHVKRDVPGFIGNRLQHALWREAIALVEEGVCSAEDVDTVVKSTLGLKLHVLGPLENADLIGLELTLAIHDYVLAHIDARPHASPLLRRLVEDGELGMKAGRGFHTWTPQTAQDARDRLFDHLVSATAKEVTAP